MNVKPEGHRYGSGQEPHERPTGLLQRILGHPVWAGLGVIIATVVAFIIYFLSASASPGTSNHGNCNIAGNNDSASCYSVSATATP